MDRRRNMLASQNKEILYNLVVTDNQNGASGAASNANITIIYTKDGTQTTLGTTFKNGDTFSVPNDATNITLSGYINGYAGYQSLSGTTYTYTFKAQKLTITISGNTSNCVVRATNENNIIGVISYGSNTSSFTCYIPWTVTWIIDADATTNKYPKISTYKSKANTASKSITVQYKNYNRLVTSGEADLGLPSGTLWAATNVGASNYYDAGLYFSWGDITGHNKGTYNFTSTNYNNGISGNGHSLTTDIPFNATYDAARANMGSTWRIPTSQEWYHLAYPVDNDWSIFAPCRLNNTFGALVIGVTNLVAIFIPKTAYQYGSSVGNEQYVSFGGLWSSQRVDSGGAAYANPSIYFNTNTANRYYGMPIRAVKSPQAVDLGNGIKWATGNLTKDSNGNYKIAEEVDPGAYFSWGDINGHNVAGQNEGYSFDQTNYNNGVSGSGHNLSTSFTSGDATYDAARAKLGNTWRIPTIEEWQWLKSNCYWNKTTLGGVSVWSITGSNGAQIFLPMSGMYMNGSTLQDEGLFASYMSTTRDCWSLSPSAHSSDIQSAWNGISIRPVYTI